MRFINTAGLARSAVSTDAEHSAGRVIIGGTRIIFDGTKKEASISINNP